MRASRGFVHCLVTYRALTLVVLVIAFKTTIQHIEEMMIEVAWE